MQINKKILSIGLILSFHGATLCMEETKTEQQIDTIAYYISEENSEIRKNVYRPLAAWLIQEREKYDNNDDWNKFHTDNHTLLKAFASKLQSPGELGMTPENIIDTIMNRTKMIQPNDDTQTLVDNIDQDILILYHALSKK